MPNLKFINEVYGPYGIKQFLSVQLLESFWGFSRGSKCVLGLFSSNLYGKVVKRVSNRLPFGPQNTRSCMEKVFVLNDSRVPGTRNFSGNTVDSDLLLGFEPRGGDTFPKEVFHHA